jgi:hypothetical protein
MANKNISKLSIGERDLYIRKLEDEIKRKRLMLIEETKNIENGKKTNKLLEPVHSDYKKYYDNIINEKQQQYDAMMLLKEYLDELKKEESLTTHQTRTIKNDQRDILFEIEKITHELKEMAK